MKEHKELKITFDVVDNHVKNAKLEGDQKDLIGALCWGGQKFLDSAINAVLRFYLEQPSRERFLAHFLSEVAKMDDMIVAQMDKAQKGKVS